MQAALKSATSSRLAADHAAHAASDGRLVAVLPRSLPVRRRTCVPTPPARRPSVSAATEIPAAIPNPRGWNRSASGARADSTPSTAAGPCTSSARRSCSSPIVIGYPVVSAVIQSFQLDAGLDKATGLFVAGRLRGRHELRALARPAVRRRSPCPPGSLGSQFWVSIGNTFFFTVVTVLARDGHRRVDGDHHEPQLPGPRPRPCRDPGAVGHPDRRHREALVLHLRRERRAQPRPRARRSSGPAASGRPGSRSSSPTPGRRRRSWRCSSWRGCS